MVSVQRTALKAALPGGDAFALQTVDPSAPPLVAVPVRTITSARWQSIIEHEVVHVNQMLLGTFPGMSFRRTLLAGTKHFTESMRVEYEANLIQLTHWPALYPASIELSLNDWCALRGYAAALEGTIEALGEPDVTADFAIALIERLHKQRRTIFRSATIGRVDLGWFDDRWPDHLCTALLAVTEKRPELKRRRSVQAIARFWTGNFGRSGAKK